MCFVILIINHNLNYTGGMKNKIQTIDTLSQEGEKGAMR